MCDAGCATRTCFPVEQVLLHFDEICLHSNRWHRSVRAQPAAADRKNIGDGGVDWGTESTPMLGIGAVVPQDDSPGEVNLLLATLEGPGWGIMTVGLTFFLAES